MALRDCPECTKSVSTEAAACPHCGCPLRRGRKKQSYLGPLLLVFAIVSIFAMFYETEDPARKNTHADALRTSSPRCDAQKAGTLVRQFTESGVLHRIETNRSVPRIYVLEPWFRLTIDDKKVIDNALQCDLTNGGANGPTLAAYHDGRNGKELATSDKYGFRME